MSFRQPRMGIPGLPATLHAALALRVFPLHCHRDLGWEMRMRAGMASLWALATAGATVGAGGIERVSWLAGCWEMSRGATTIQEQWMAPRGGSMLGMSRTIRRDSLVEFESVLLRERGDTLAYEARPSGQPGAVFLAAEVSDSHVVFANPQHDFPQRVSYRRRGDSLLARVEGVRNGQLRGFDFPYRRAPCADGTQ